jgi:hypothetical protein
MPFHTQLLRSCVRLLAASDSPSTSSLHQKSKVKSQSRQFRNWHKSENLCPLCSTLMSELEFWQYRQAAVLSVFDQRIAPKAARVDRTRVVYQNWSTDKQTALLALQFVPLSCSRTLGELIQVLDISLQVCLAQL